MDSAFINTFINTLRKSFSFEGRSSKRELWQWYFIVANGMVIFYILPSTLHPNTTFSEISACFCIACSCVPSCSISVRRFHDLGHSGWFTLLILIPIVGLIISLYPLFKTGNKVANQYGPPTIDQNLTVFDKVWLWTFIGVTLFYTLRIIYLIYSIFNQ